jgi:hypothetical protein
VKTAYGYGTVVPDKTVVAEPVTIRPLKNVVQIHLLISAVLIKLAVKGIVVTQACATTVIAPPENANTAAKIGNAVSMAIASTPCVTIATH